MPSSSARRKTTARPPSACGRTHLMMRQWRQAPKPSLEGTLYALHNQGQTGILALRDNSLTPGIAALGGFSLAQMGTVNDKVDWRLRATWPAEREDRFKPSLNTGTSDYRAMPSSSMSSLRTRRAMKKWREEMAAVQNTSAKLRPTYEKLFYPS